MFRSIAFVVLATLIAGCSWFRADERPPRAPATPVVEKPADPAAPSVPSTPTEETTASPQSADDTAEAGSELPAPAAATADSTGDATTSAESDPAPSEAEAPPAPREASAVDAPAASEPIATPVPVVTVTPEPLPDPAPPVVPDAVQPSESMPSGGDASQGETAAAPPPESPTPASDTSAVLHTLDGRVDLTATGGDVGASAADAVIYFVPDAGAPAPTPGQYVVRTEHKRFLPDVLVVPVGSTVAFPNDDDILHNVFSLSANAEFDLGRYGRGESRSYTFDEPGLALVHCDVHHAMQADILVVDTPYFTRARDDGTFVLADLPGESGMLHVWHPRAETQTRRVSLPADGRIEWSVSLVRPRVADHVNKRGRSYRAALREAPASAGNEPSRTVSDSPAPAPEVDAGSGGHVLSGQVELVGDGAAEDGGLADAIAYYVPAGGAPAPTPGEFEIRTENKRFLPDVLVVPVGSTVAFPNDDNLLHNVFSISDNAGFDLGTYGLNESRSHTFDQAGLALVYCNVHHAMQADVLVVDTPYYVRVNADGRFRLDDLPAGEGTLHLWHPRSETARIDVFLPDGEPLIARLEVVRPRVPAHVNKRGESYGAARRGVNE